MWTETPVSHTQEAGEAPDHRTLPAPAFYLRTWLLTGILLIGSALRIGLLTDYRFHPDEALFATLGRTIISGQDVLLQHTALLVDKPPLFYYLLAGGISLSWGEELAARLPALFASILSLALAARLAGRVWRSDLSAVAAALLIALSPFAILFAPTAFADPILVTWVLAALVAVSEGRWGWSGVLIGCAAATKQSGLYFVPLVLALGLVTGVGTGTGWRKVGRWLGRWFIGAGAMAALVVGWEVIRQAPTTFWQAGVEANDPGRLIRAVEVWPRLRGWAAWLCAATGSGWLNVGLLVLVVAGSAWLLSREGPSRGNAAVLVLGAFLAAYFTFHWLVAFPLLDRYMLPPVVLGLVLAGGLPGRLAAQPRWKGAGPVIVLIVAATMIPGATRAERGGYPVGGDHGSNDGIRVVADYLERLPEGSVVYYESLGWPLAYYLFDAYLYLAPVDSGAALADDLETFAVQSPQTERRLVLPGCERQSEILDPTLQAGFTAEPVLTTINRQGTCSFVVYRLRPADD